MKDSTYTFVITAISVMILIASLVNLTAQDRQYHSCLKYAIEHKMTIEDKIKVCG